MRDGEGNKLSPEETRPQSIQAAPDKDSLNKVSISPDSDKDAGESHKPQETLSHKPAAGVGQ